MKRHIFQTLSISLIFVFFSVASGFVPALDSSGSQQVVSAAASTEDACQGLKQLGGGGCGGGQSGINKVAVAVVNIISFVAGVIAVIMIIFSGIRFMTSGGDSSKIATAKTALIYAIIGIAVAGLAQILIRFVISAGASA